MHKKMLSRNYRREIWVDKIWAYIKLGCLRLYDFNMYQLFASHRHLINTIELYEGFVRECKDLEFVSKQECNALLHDLTMKRKQLYLQISQKPTFESNLTRAENQFLTEIEEIRQHYLRARYRNESHVLLEQQLRKHMNELYESLMDIEVSHDMHRITSSLKENNMDKISAIIKDSNLKISTSMGALDGIENSMKNMTTDGLLTDFITKYRPEKMNINDVRSYLSIDIDTEFELAKKQLENKPTLAICNS